MDFVGVRTALVTAMAVALLAVAASPAHAETSPTPLKSGDVMPRLAGDALSGKEAVLPDAAKGKIALVALGFSYDARFPVEAWGGWFKKQYGGRAGVTYFEVPMMGRAARMGRFFIDRGMRKNTPKEAHDNVITVYGDTSEWKARMGVTDAREKEAFLVLLDAGGVVRWMHAGPFDEKQADVLKNEVERLLGGR